MSSALTRQLALAAGALAIVGMGSLTAAQGRKEAGRDRGPSQKLQRAGACSPPKAVGGGANSFSPSVTARPAHRAAGQRRHRRLIGSTASAERMTKFRR